MVDEYDEDIAMKYDNCTLVTPMEPADYVFSYIEKHIPNTIGVAEMQLAVQSRENEVVKFGDTKLTLSYTYSESDTHHKYLVKIGHATETTAQTVHIEDGAHTDDFIKTLLQEPRILDKGDDLKQIFFELAKMDPDQRNKSKAALLEKYATLDDYSDAVDFAYSLQKDGKEYIQLVDKDGGEIKMNLDVNNFVNFNSTSFATRRKNNMYWNQELFIQFRKETGKPPVLRLMLQHSANVEVIRETITVIDPCKAVADLFTQKRAQLQYAPDMEKLHIKYRTIEGRALDYNTVAPKVSEIANKFLTSETCVYFFKAFEYAQESIDVNEEYCSVTVEENRVKVTPKSDDELEWSLQLHARDFKKAVKVPATKETHLLPPGQYEVYVTNVGQYPLSINLEHYMHWNKCVIHALVAYKPEWLIAELASNLTQDGLYFASFVLKCLDSKTHAQFLKDLLQSFDQASVCALLEISYLLDTDDTKKDGFLSCNLKQIAAEVNAEWFMSGSELVELFSGFASSALLYDQSKLDNLRHHVHKISCTACDNSPNETPLQYFIWFDFERFVQWAKTDSVGQRGLAFLCSRVSTLYRKPTVVAPHVMAKTLTSSTMYTEFDNYTFGHCFVWMYRLLASNFALSDAVQRAYQGNSFDVGMLLKLTQTETLSDVQTERYRSADGHYNELTVALNSITYKLAQHDIRQRLDCFQQLFENSMG